MIAGKVWKFGSNINTDLIMPGPALYLPPAQRARHVFQAIRPGWVDEISPGDIIVAGHNFGVGSSRPAALSLCTLGLSCLIAESINSLFFRNCVNFGFPAMECDHICAAFEEGQIAEVSFEDRRVHNASTGRTLEASPIPDQLIQIMLGGGIFPALEAQGLIGNSKDN